MPETPVLKRIGRYDIDRVLGEGAMGVVYEGNDTRLHRKVAIKTILKSALDSSSAKEYSMRFAREAQAVARLNHPNIVQVFDFAEEGDVAYIAWSAETPTMRVPIGTDTFVVRNGKILVQTFAAYSRR